MSNDKNSTITEKIEEISNLYIDTLKPLIILIEVNETIYPIEILNDVRGYADHISKCLCNNLTEEQKEYNVNKAYEHITRAIIDCYKILIVYNFELLEKLKKEYPTVDLHDVDNGEFYIKYNRIEYNVKEKLKNVKYKEENDIFSIVELGKMYEDVFNESESIKSFIESNRSKIEWTRLKYKKHKIRSSIAWIISIILTCILTNNNQQILQWIIDFLKKKKNIIAK